MNDSKLCRRLGALSLGLLVLVMGSCQSARTPERLGGGGRIGNYDEQVDRGETSGARRPFGQRFERFGVLVAKESRDFVDDFGKRVDILGDEAGRWTDRRAEEVQETRRFLAAAPKAPLVDAALHQESLGDTLGGAWNRARRDASCFWERAWRALKMLE